MTTTLKIKNETGAELRIETGGVPLKLAKDAEAELSEKELKSPGLVKAVEAASISFIKINQPDEKQLKLAQEVLSGLVKSAGGRLGAAKGRFEQSQKELFKLREGFNKTWKAAEKNLEAAQDDAKIWENVKKSVKSWRDVLKVEDPALAQKRKEEDAIKKRIAALKKEDLNAENAREMEAWLADLQKQMAALNQAQAEIKKLEMVKGPSLEKALEDGDAAAGAMTGLKKEKVIGTEIAEFGK